MCMKMQSVKSMLLFQYALMLLSAMNDFSQ